MNPPTEQMGKYFAALTIGSIYIYFLFMVVDELSDDSSIIAAVTGTVLLSVLAWTLIVFNRAFKHTSTQAHL
ncbi:MAG: hypothetical protein ABSA11_10860 [Candidatus Bathyarchaeia archaeon]|jgi:hypothetical protein